MITHRYQTVIRMVISNWILALHGVQRTDAMSRSRAREQLLGLQLEIKSTDDDVDIVEQAVLDMSPHLVCLRAPSHVATGSP